LKGTDPEHIDFEDSGITCFSEEYNDACNCHPEYRQEEFFISFADLMHTPEDFASQLEAQREAEKRCKQLEKEEKKRQGEERREAQDRAELSRLQEKYK